MTNLFASLKVFYYTQSLSLDAFFLLKRTYVGIILLATIISNEQ